MSAASDVSTTKETVRASSWIGRGEGFHLEWHRLPVSIRHVQWCPFGRSSFGSDPFGSLLVVLLVVLSPVL